MVAEIYPIKRMPASFAAFDYLIPDGTNVTRGDLVAIPFRTSTNYGIVSRIKPHGPAGMTLKPITSVVSGLRLSEWEISYLERLARELSQSVSSLLFAGIPTPPKRDVQQLDFTSVSEPKTVSEQTDETESVARRLNDLDNAFVFSSDLKHSTSIIAHYRRSHPDGAMLVIAPNVRDAKFVHAHLAAFCPSFVSGDETGTARYRAWTSFRRSPNGMLVGTRLGVLMSHPNLTTVCLVRSGHDNHYQAAQNPKYDTRSASRLMTQLTKCKRFLFDVAPRTEDLALLDPSNVIVPGPFHPATIVVMKKERLTAPHPAIGGITSVRITEALAANRKVLCVFNRKGLFRFIRCEDCDYFQRLDTAPAPTVCPTCQGVNLKRKGFGNRAVADALKKLFPQATVAILDRETTDTDLSKVTLLLTTRYYLENVFDPFHPSDFGLVAELDADIPLSQQGGRALEAAVISVEEWRGIAKACGAGFVIQTDVPDLFAAYMNDPLGTLQAELESQKAYGLTEPLFRD